MGIAPEVVMWRDVGDIDGVLYVARYWRTYTALNQKI